MSKRIIAVDLDGCIANFNISYAKILMRLHPEITFDYLNTESWPEKWGYDEIVPKELRSQAWQEIMNSGMFWKFLHPYPNTLLDLENLYNNRQYLDTYFVTTRPGATAKAETEDWLRGQGYPGATVVVVTGDVKHQITHAIGADAIIDDKPSNMFGHEENCIRFLFDRPYNRGKIGYPFNHRVRSITEALTILGGLNVTSGHVFRGKYDGEGTGNVERTGEAVV